MYLIKMKQAQEELKKRLRAKTGSVRPPTRPRILSQEMNKTEARLLLAIGKAKLDWLLRTGKLPDLHPVSLQRYLRIDHDKPPAVLKTSSEAYERYLKEKKEWEDREKAEREQLAKAALEQV